MKKINYWNAWSLAVGAMDAVTGLLLIFAPAWVLGILGIELPGKDAIIYLNWIGVFVMAVGLSYGFALGRRPGAVEATWGFTAMARLLVALFLTSQIVGGQLETAWAVVAASDAVVAVVQGIVLLRGGRKGVER